MIAKDRLVSPSTGKDLGPRLAHSIDELNAAVATAHDAQRLWRSVRYRQKAAIVRRAAAFVVTNADRIAATISACTGKTRIDALSTEVIPAALSIHHYARLARAVIRPHRERRSSILFFNKRTVVRREPFGVVGIISPWNYPLGIPIHEVISGLLCGNGVILKVATQVQPVGELIAEMIASAGFPTGLFRVVHLPGSIAGPAFLASGIDKLFFTGSTAVGRILMREAAERLIPVNLELGGNDAMIVLSDAKLDRAAFGAIWAGVSNCGQSCGAVERIYVEEPVYDQFVSILAAAVSQLRHGSPESDPDVGSITTDEQWQIVSAQLEEALSHGAVIRARSKGSEPDREHLLFPAMVVEISDDEISLMRDETFGPILAVQRVKNEEEAIVKANDCYLGLTASVWTSSRARARGVAGRLEAGTVTINDHLMSHGMAEAPWGGYKQSGIGRSHGAAGIREMTQEKAVVTELLPGVVRNMWWQPYSKAMHDGLRAVLDLLFGKSFPRRIAAAVRVVRLFPASRIGAVFGPALTPRSRLE